MDTLLACLPEPLRGPETTVARFAAGLSGAGVYRVDAGGRALALKVSAPDEPADQWRRALELRRLAAGAGLAPRVVHADEARRAVVSEFVAGPPFPALYRDPARHDAALALLGRTIRGIHALPLPAGGAAPPDVRALVAAEWRAIGEGDGVPPFAVDAVRRALDEERPAPEEPDDDVPVLSHNDLNPSNVVHDGERLVLLDWETASANDRHWDLATVSLFLRMDAATRARLVAAYRGAPVARVPARLDHARRLVAAFVGTTFLRLARAGGHAGGAADAPTLAECYERMRAGTLRLTSADGKWAMGLVMLREGGAP